MNNGKKTNIGLQDTQKDTQSEKYQKNVMENGKNYSVISESFQYLLKSIIIESSQML